MFFNIVWVFAILGSSLAHYDYINNNTQFSDELVKTIADHELNNFVVSPLGISEALKILSYGAGGQTLEEMTTYLHTPPHVAEIWQVTEDFRNDLEGESKVRIEFLNRLYVSPEFRFNSTLERAISNNDKSIIQKKNFSSPTLAGEINEWVERSTQGTIKTAVEPDTLKPDTKMLVMNVLYFEIKWEGFSYLPLRRTFYLSNGTEVETLAISNDNVLCPHYENETVRMASIPFLNKNFQMTVVMSKKDGHEAPSLSESLELMRVRSLKKLTINLPKVLIESSHNLQPIMETMKAGSMFSQFSANFTNFGEGDLYVSSFVQKAYITITDHGVEASAFTKSSNLSPRQSETTVYAGFNRPFFAYITYKSMPLFALHVTDPRHESFESEYISPYGPDE